jgi:hypothetical protein
VSGIPTLHAAWTAPRGRPDLRALGQADRRLVIARVHQHRRVRVERAAPVRPPSAVTVDIAALAPCCNTARRVATQRAVRESSAAQRAVLQRNAPCVNAAQHNAPCCDAAGRTTCHCTRAAARSPVAQAARSPAPARSHVSLRRDTRWAVRLRPEADRGCGWGGCGTSVRGAPQTTLAKQAAPKLRHSALNLESALLRAFARLHGGVCADARMDVYVRGRARVRVRACVPSRARWATTRCRVGVVRATAIRARRRRRRRRRRRTRRRRHGRVARRVARAELLDVRLQRQRTAAAAQSARQQRRAHSVWCAFGISQLQRCLGCRRPRLGRRRRRSAQRPTQPVPSLPRASATPAAGQCHPCRGPVPRLPRASATPAAGRVRSRLPFGAGRAVRADVPGGVRAACARRREGRQVQPCPRS